MASKTKRNRDLPSFRHRLQAIHSLKNLAKGTPSLLSHRQFPTSIVARKLPNHRNHTNDRLRKHNPHPKSIHVCTKKENFSAQSRTARPQNTIFYNTDTDTKKADIEEERVAQNDVSISYKQALERKTRHGQSTIPLIVLASSHPIINVSALHQPVSAFYRFVSA